MKIFGPYKGSKQNGGRPIYVIKRKKKDGTTETTSTNKARLDFKRATGKRLARTTDVDHKDNGGREGKDGIENLQTMSHSKNVGKENKRRTVKKAVKKTIKKAVKKKP
jgi:mRNA-degrading endonuclease toxin of MazEF toxin-antitoxin module